MTAASKSCTIQAVYNGETQETSCSITLPTSGYSYNGWTFNGWGTGPSSTSGSGAGTTKYISSNLTYYATWIKESKTITVSYNCTKGSGSTASTSCTIPAVYNGETQDTSCDVALASNSCSYSGWSFNGWGTYNGATSGTAAGTTITVSSPQTRYAVWRKPLTLTCSKGANVSSIGATSKTCFVYNGSTAGCSVTLPSITPNSGYTSVGWSTSSGATSGTAAGSSITITASTTRYANATDQTAPSCGAVNGAGSSSSWAKTRTITVTCTETGGSGCSQASFSRTFNSGTVTTSSITISDVAGNQETCPVNVYVDTEGPSCGTVRGDSTTWSTTARDIYVACNETGGSGCADNEFWKSFTDTKVGVIQIQDKAGNPTNCTVNAYVDTTAPSCGQISGASTSWITSGSRTITVACSDTVSGCKNSSESKTFSDSMKTGTITITNGAGIPKNCTVNVYIDKGAPTITCSKSNTGTTSGVNISCTCSDSVSDISGTCPSYTGQKESKTISISDNAGNSASTTVTITSQLQKSSCSSASWTSSSQKVGSCLASGSTYTYSYSTCSSALTASVCQAFGFTSGVCYNKTTYTRTACNSWGGYSSATSCNNVSYTTRCRTVYN
ncbi:MAG: InlB B-repeat-containing protein [Bacilli bacterium]|nr:InlB B-repeat-containing protein [Bacilli bacterium]